MEQMGVFNFYFKLSSFDVYYFNLNLTILNNCQACVGELEQEVL